MLCSEQEASEWFDKYWNNMNRMQWPSVKKKWGHSAAQFDICVPPSHIHWGTSSAHRTLIDWFLCLRWPVVYQIIKLCKILLLALRLRCEKARPNILVFWPFSSSLFWREWLIFSSFSPCSFPCMEWVNCDLSLFVNENEMTFKLMLSLKYSRMMKLRNWNQALYSVYTVSSASIC